MASSHTPTPEAEEGSDGVSVDIDFDVDKIVDAISGLPQDIVDALILNPIQALANTIFNALTIIITWYPYPSNYDAIHDLWALSLTLSITLFTALITLYGIIYMVRGWFTENQLAILKDLPLMIGALGFGAAAIPLLTLAIKTAEAVTHALKPNNPGIWAVLGFSTEILLIAWVSSILLIIIVLMLGVQKIYLLAGVALAPLLALGYAFPPTRSQAGRFIRTWWAMLALSPVEMVLVRIIIGLLEQGGPVPQLIQNWFLTLGGLAAMVAVPYMIHEAGFAAAGGQALAPVVHKAQQKARSKTKSTLMERWPDYNPGIHGGASAVSPPDPDTYNGQDTAENGDRSNHQRPTSGAAKNYSVGTAVRTCPRCGGDAQLMVRDGSNGKFLGCSNYPDCEHTEDFDTSTDTSYTSPGNSETSGGDG